MKKTVRLNNIIEVTFRNVESGSQYEIIRQ